MPEEPAVRVEVPQAPASQPEVNVTIEQPNPPQDVERIVKECLHAEMPKLLEEHLGKCLGHIPGMLAACGDYMEELEMTETGNLTPSPNNSPERETLPTPAGSAEATPSVEPTASPPGAAVTQVDAPLAPPNPSPLVVKLPWYRRMRLV